MKTFAITFVIATAVAVTPMVLVEEGCTPAERAELGQVENIVLADIEAGKTDQIEADVAKVIVGDGGLTLIDTLISDAIQTLIDLKKISAGKLPVAVAMRSKIQATMQAKAQAASDAAAPHQ